MRHRPCGTSPAAPVPGSSGATVAPRSGHKEPTELRFSGTSGCRAKCAALFCDTGLPPLPTHVMSIGDPPPAGNQAAAQCVRQPRVTLCGDCPARSPCHPGTIAPTLSRCEMAMRRCHMLHAGPDNIVEQLVHVQLQVLSRSVGAVC